MESFLNVASKDGAMSKRRPNKNNSNAGVTTIPNKLPNTALKAAAAVLPGTARAKGGRGSYR